MQKYIPSGLKRYMQINRVCIFQENIIGAEEKFLTNTSNLDAIYMVSLTLN